jgi:cytochrome b subunit of formate dehydrogenase
MPQTHAASGSPVLYQRFDRYHRILHGVLMFSFLGLAFTGMPLLFNDAPWAMRLASLFGGGRAAGILHRVFASLLIGCFALHVWRLVYRLYVKKEFEVLWGPASMTPQPRDAAEMLAHIRWFLRLGPRPRFDHFTYWEKFDYWAVFWGMGIIGGSGLVLWFPEFFSHLLSGSWFNIALLVHGEEGLLAVGFIFTIHFFNSHLRPDKFPMDPVIFTGRITEHEMREERPAEFARLAAARRLDEAEVGPAAPWVGGLARTVAVIAVSLGLAMVALILYAVLFARP